MTDDSGLQIDIRCVNCGSFHIANNPLLEMQNHRYICNNCRQQAEQRGKHITWAAGIRPQPLHAQTRTASFNQTGTINRTRKTINLPSDSLFAALGLPLSSSPEEISKAIKQHMRTLLREEDAPERTRRIEQLHGWQDLVENPQAFQKYVQSSQPIRQTLSVGGKLVYRAEEFVEACEASREGWADGERYLRNGQLRAWVFYRMEDNNQRDKNKLSRNISSYEQMKAVSDFQALNEALYCLMPERPFRFYERDAWQPIKTVPSASTPEKLAQVCDLYWELAEHHLYEGSLGFWLEQSRGIQGLQEYYQDAVAGYAQEGRDRGVGLELLLERALPTLLKPHLVITLDGMKNHWETPEQRWDRELPHKPITVKVSNTTRGFTSIALTLEQPPTLTEPEWIVLEQFPALRIAGRPGDAMPATRNIRLVNLAQLKRWHTYKRHMIISMRKEYGKPAEKQMYPITLKTMRFFDGLYGILWRFGLRGGFAGLLWNFAMGLLLAFLCFLLITGLVTTPFITQAENIIPLQSELSFGTVLQALVAGTSEIIRLQFHGIGFALIVACALGLPGFCVGYRQGHANYTEQQGVSMLRKWTRWLVLAFTIFLIGWGQGGLALVNAFRYGGGPFSLNAFFLFGGTIFVGLLFFIIACAVASIRYRLEKYLRRHYADLLNQPGRA